MLNHMLVTDILKGPQLEKLLPRTKIESDSCFSNSFVMFNSLAMEPNAGAVMVDDTGLINVNVDTTKTAAHF